MKPPTRARTCGGPCKAALAATREIDMMPCRTLDHPMQAGVKSFASPLGQPRPPSRQEPVEEPEPTPEQGPDEAGDELPDEGPDEAPQDDREGIEELAAR
jgi:hypothetical protein